jgi:hypothetical protein
MTRPLRRAHSIVWILLSLLLPLLLALCLMSRQPARSNPSLYWENVR